jgi:hypothetical protein
MPEAAHQPLKSPAKRTSASDGLLQFRECIETACHELLPQENPHLLVESFSGARTAWQFELPLDCYAGQ